MADLPDDGRGSTPGSTKSHLTPMRVRALISRSGTTCPLYRYTPGPEEGPLNESVQDSSADGWTDTYYSAPTEDDGNADPEMDSGSPEETQHGTWAYVGDILASRVYGTENELEVSDGQTDTTDEPNLLVPAGSPAQKGDRVKYDGEEYQLTNPTHFDVYVSWTLEVDKP